MEVDLAGGQGGLLFRSNLLRLVEQPGLADQGLDPDPRQVGGIGGDQPVDVGDRVAGEVAGVLGDVTGQMHRHSQLGHQHPQPREAVRELQGVAHEQLRTGAGPAERGPQLDRGELRDQGCAFACQREEPLAERVTGVAPPGSGRFPRAGTGGVGLGPLRRCDQEVDIGPRLGREGVDRPLQHRRRARGCGAAAGGGAGHGTTQALAADSPVRKSPVSTGFSKEPQPANANEDRSMLLSPAVASWARHSPMAAECLNPWPEQGDATITRGAEGNRSITKRLSGVTV